MLTLKGTLKSTLFLWSLNGAFEDLKLVNYAVKTNLVNYVLKVKLGSNKIVLYSI
jgi:hypothetical protein